MRSSSRARLHQPVEEVVRRARARRVVALAVASPRSPVARERDGDGGRGLGHYAQRNLVSDVPGAAELTDPNLVNAWGLAFGPTTPAWVADNGTDVSTLYSGAVGRHAGGEGAADGLDPGRRADRHGLQRLDRVRRALRHELRPGALPVLLRGGDDHAAGTRPSRRRRRRRRRRPPSPCRARSSRASRSPTRRPARSSTRPTSTTARSTSGTRTSRPCSAPGAFTDPAIPRRLRAVRHPGHRPAGSSSPTPSRTPTPRTTSPGPATGFVDVFDTGGTLLRRFAARGALNAPWGVAPAPQGFGGRERRAADRQLRRRAHQRLRPGRAAASSARCAASHGRPIAIDGLWALEFGNGVIGTPQTLLFTAGPAEEAHGLFGELTAASEHHDD